MYHYTKEVKEKLFSDACVALLWLRYRVSSFGSDDVAGKSNIEEGDEVDPQIRRMIDSEFDAIAHSTLRKGTPNLWILSQSFTTSTQ